jgi:uncharacterized repeat protein (TIGR03943 family)
MIVNKSIGYSGILVAILVFSLILREKIGFLINPEYFWYILVSAIISCIFAIIYIFPSKHSVVEKPTWQQIVLCLGFLCVVVSGILVPVKPLGVKNVAFTTKSTFEKPKSSLSQLVKSPEVITSLGLVDWQNLLNSEKNATKYNGQKAEFNGFVSGYIENGFELSSYQVSCCVVDASLSTISMVSKDKPPLDSWQKVNGNFQISGKKPNLSISFIIDSRIEINTPLSPYSSKK